MKIKVFGIGLNKTGTTTLGTCLKTLGYKHQSYSFDLVLMYKAGLLDEIRRNCIEYESFEDWPYPLIYQQLDQWFPGSKFILTTRISEEAWLKSLEKHAMRVDPQQGSETRTIAYGFPYPQLNPSAHVEIYRNHCRSVRQYFTGRPDSLLEVCWEKEAGWHELCTFLGCEMPKTDDFPHSNRASLPSDEILQRNLCQLKALQSDSL